MDCSGSFQAGIRARPFDSANGCVHLVMAYHTSIQRGDSLGNDTCLEERTGVGIQTLDVRASA